jgi:hypothetical protein
VPLKRLNASLRRKELVDSAIDLGIAIDALFLAEREPDRGELTFTLRLRAARFLEATEAGRREISRFFSTLYKLRSSAVHAGEISDSVDKVPARQLVQRGQELTATALQRMIVDGPPDWQKLIFS